MPLSFLKKKRAREGQSDPPSAPSTNTTTSSHRQQRPPDGVSPGAAAAASGTPSGGGQPAVAAGRSAAAPAPAPAPPQAGGGQQQRQQHQQQGALNIPHAHSQPHHHQQPPAPAQPPPGAGTNTNATAVSPPPPHPPPHDPHTANAPTIANLVANAPQNDGTAYVNSPNQISPDAATFDNGAASLEPPIVHTISASPGTDPAILQQQYQQQYQEQQQQQQAATTLPPQGATNTAAMQSDQLAHAQQHGQLQSGVQQQYYQPGHQHQVSNSTPRVTKGKYTLGDFEILRTLGTGSFGRVHLVQSKHNQRFYAIKVLKKAQVVKMKQVEHTNDERRMLSDVKHPFLITLWGTFQDWKNLYMVMDFVEGGELFTLLRKSGRFPNPVAKFYAAEVTLALEYMHSKNIIYRDLKPENLLLDRHGHLKITDFGFAKRVPDKTWTLCGTPDYLAPEVVSNKGYNKSVDWWSLGILIYEMLCGYTPFWDSGSPMRIYENILKGKVKYPAYIVPEAQDLLQKLITADLTKRLGNLYGGSTDVKNHPWFHEVTWDRLARKDIDAPYTPPVKAGAGDASLFDKYPEEQEKYGVATGNDEFGHLFTEF